MVNAETYLQKALHALPFDNREARYHIQQALRKLQKPKPKAQPTAAQTWHDMIQHGIHSDIPKRTLDVINQMIAAQTPKNTPPDTLLTN